MHENNFTHLVFNVDAEFRNLNVNWIAKNNSCTSKF